MVEPVPVLFEALRNNYAESSGLRFVQAACAEAPGRSPFYQVRNIEAMTWDGMRGLSSFNQDIMRPHFASDEAFEMFVEQVDISVVTADSIVAQAGLPRLDLVLIDTAGADYRVLQGFDVAAHRPKLLMLEHLHLSAADRAAIYRRIVELGYRRFVGAMDSFYYLPSLLGADELQTLAMFETPVLSLR